MGSLLPFSWVKNPMREHLDTTFEVSCQEQGEVRLDLVVPFTTPELTRAALAAANRLGAGLSSTIRLLKIQLIPYPLDLRDSPVPVEFLEAQLRKLPSTMATDCEIRFARDFEDGLRGALNEDSVVLLATKRRFWKTATERLAASLRRSGFQVVLVPAGERRFHA